VTSPSASFGPGRRTSARGMAASYPWLLVSARSGPGILEPMGLLIAALVIILAVVVAVAIAEFVIGLVIVVAGVIGAIYIWRRLTGERSTVTP
jgi:Flp pilus assembly protein TadB